MFCSNKSVRSVCVKKNEQSCSKELIQETPRHFFSELVNLFAEGDEEKRQKIFKFLERKTNEFREKKKLSNEVI